MTNSSPCVWCRRASSGWDRPLGAFRPEPGRPQAPPPRPTARRGPDDSPAGVTGDAGPLFVALARLTGEPDPVPLEELVSVRTGDGADAVVHGRFGGGPKSV